MVLAFDNHEAVVASGQGRVDPPGRVSGDKESLAEGRIAGLRLEDARTRLEKIALRVSVLEQARDAFERSEHAEGWRREDHTRLHDRLDDHRGGVLTVCVQADDPVRDVTEIHGAPTCSAVVEASRPQFGPDSRAVAERRP